MLADFSKWEKALPKTRMVDRDAFILERCRGKAVIHMGAVDSPFTEEKAAKGELLHQLLMKVSDRVVGFDHDGPAIEHLRSVYGIQNIKHTDLTDDSPGTVQGDIVVCGDIIEHVDNQARLLGSAHSMCAANGVLILSTINAISLKQVVRALSRREPVHPDHVAYYSFATLGALLSRYDFEPTEYVYFKYPTVGKLSGLIFDGVYRLFPHVADGILIVARKR